MKGEQTGCPEVAESIALVTYMTDQEFTDILHREHAAITFEELETAMFGRPVAQAGQSIPKPDQGGGAGGLVAFEHDKLFQHDVEAPQTTHTCGECGNHWYRKHDGCPFCSVAPGKPIPPETPACDDFEIKMAAHAAVCPLCHDTGFVGFVRCPRGCAGPEPESLATTTPERIRDAMGRAAVNGQVARGLRPEPTPPAEPAPDPDWLREAVEHVVEYLDELSDCEGLPHSSEEALARLRAALAADQKGDA